jgi:hypothetical protein
VAITQRNQTTLRPSANSGEIEQARHRTAESRAQAEMDLRDQQLRLADGQPVLDTVRRAEIISQQFGSALMTWCTAAAANLGRPTGAEGR